MSDPNPNITGTPPSPGPGTPAVTTTPAPAAVKPAAAPKPPAKPPVKGKVDAERRGFLLAMFGGWFAVAWTTFVGTMALWFLGTLRFLFPNVLAEPPNRVKVGFPENFEEGKVTDKFKDQNLWVVRHEGKIYALSTTCTHLGCTPNWLESAGKFKCPCHGSGFYITGINFEGPAPRPLERWGISIGDDGQIVVDKSKKFQQERGDWTNPESFITV
jgi:cytochrome b6-f complex iron-sulfur subunit